MFTVYQVTNHITGKIYVGVHKTSNPYDSYLGSGKIIRQSVKKYGKHNFTKIILHVYDTSEEAYSKEREIVNEEFISNPLTYNTQLGGIPSTEWTDRRRQRHTLLTTGARHHFYGKHHSEETKAKISASGRGKKHSQERIEKSASKRRGQPSKLKGRTLSDNDKLKKSIAALQREKIMCPHCSKMSDPGNAKKWHFEKCKSLTQKIATVISSI